MSSKIDFGRAAILMDVVQKVANVSPAYMALSGAAMNELKEMNDVAIAEQRELGERRLREEQEAAAKINEQNRLAAEKQAKIDAEIAERTAASNAVKPITVMPGEPVPDVIREATGEADDPTPHEVEYYESTDTTPVKRRI